MIRILFLAASPRDMSQLGLDKEIRTIKEKVRASEYRDSLEIVSEWAVRPDDLLQIFNEQSPTIVHFSGHGSKEHQLCLQNDQDQVTRVSKEALNSLFKVLGGKTRVVFFNACHSQGQSEAILEHVDCAIGMSKAVGDLSAIAFASSFYRALGFGCSVKEAYDQGITAIELGGLRGPETPQLLSREGVDPAAVYLLREEERRANVPVEWLEYAPEPASLEDGQSYHAFLSYRSADRAWGLGLYDALRQHGCKVFLDQCALAAGSTDAARLAELDKSAAGVLVLSADCEASKSEFELMEGRAGDSFHFVPLHLEREPPAFARGRACLDFSNRPDGPGGGELLKLLHAIAGRPLSEGALRFAVEQEGIDQAASEEIDAAILNGRPTDLIALFEAGGLPWRSSPTLGCRVAQGLTRLGSVDDALRVLEALETSFPDAIRPKQLRAHALTRQGGEANITAAQKILAKLVAAGEEDPETLGLYGRTWWDRYRSSRDKVDLRESRDYYARAFERAGDDYYTGINAAAKSVFLDDLDGARAYAERTNAILDSARSATDYWSLATRGEAALILGDYSAAAQHYAAGVSRARREKGSQESTWRQACGLKGRLGISEQDWKPIRAAFEDFPDHSQPL